MGNFLQIHFLRSLAILTLFLMTLATRSAHGQPELELQPNDHICYIGNTLADRMQHDAWLETYIQALYPELNLTFRNLGFSADEIKTRPRSDNFGSPDQWLTKCQADVIFCFFGYNEALRGPDGLAQFEKDLAESIDEMRSKQYNGKSAPRLVFFSPIAHENLKSPNLPDGSKNNANLKLYSESMKRICDSKNVPFVDLFNPSGELYQRSSKPLTMNGIHLLNHGNKALAQAIIPKLFPGKQAACRCRNCQIARRHPRQELPLVQSLPRGRRLQRVRWPLETCLVRPVQRGRHDARNGDL